MNAYFAKLDISSKIAFAVSSQVDSRTILDSAGAEKLLGRGDMLFNPIGSSKPNRLQGCYVSDEEVELTVGGMENIDRKVHRNIRELKYYYLENKVFADAESTTIAPDAEVANIRLKRRILM